MRKLTKNMVNGNVQMLRVQSRPIVAVIGDETYDDKDRLIAHTRKSYLDTLINLCDVQPIILPPMQDAVLNRTGFVNLIGSIDGVLLTGNVSNVDPARYNAELLDDTAKFDHARDDTVLSAIPKIVAAGVPLLAICRGMQEMNIAYGGTLHQAVHDLPGKLYHRWTDGYLAVDNYAPRHTLKVKEGGLLAQILPTSEMYLINSLHEQAVDQLGRGLRVEGVAEDGVVEALSVTNAPNFALGVEWHPEWERVRETVPNKPIFTAFARAVFGYNEKRINGHVE